MSSEERLFQIVDCELNLRFPRGRHLHTLIAQLPIRLSAGTGGCHLAEGDQQWQEVRSVLELVAAGEGNLRKIHFLLFPESAVPVDRVEEALGIIGECFPANSVTVFGVEHTPLSRYREFLERYRSDNAEACRSVDEDRAASEIDGVPVNWSVTAVKEDDGRLRVFLQAKSHPFVGEETFDAAHDLYRGKVFPFFRCPYNGFNFLSLICLDYIYRDLYHSNISAVIQRANELFYQTRQHLDLLLVLECNPKPEHPAFRDVVNGFYGGYLESNPGVRDTITLFCNSSEESSGLAVKGDYTYGHSSVIIHRSHKLGPVSFTEFVSDDFAGLPVCRLRFGTETRLYYFNLPLFHELDPRMTRVPLKIHGIFEPVMNGGWQRIRINENGQGEKTP